MLVEVIATSNSPYLYRPASEWRKLHNLQLTDGVPTPNELAEETDEVLGDFALRLDLAQKALKDRLADAKPEVLVVVGYDDGTFFSDVQVPQLCTYLGEQLSGSAAINQLGETADQRRVTLTCDPTFALELHDELVFREFDMSYMREQNPQGRPEWGASGAFTRIGEAWLADAGVPVVPMMINCLEEPMLRANRILEFGAAIGEIAEASDKRVAILAVGGLSHDPNGARAGWIDDRLDRFVLKQLAAGRSTRLERLFDPDSDTLRGGTAQIRTWLAAAAAAETKGGRAHVVDYVPALTTITGMAFAYWSLRNSAAA